MRHQTPTTSHKASSCSGPLSPDIYEQDVSWEHIALAGCLPGGVVTNVPRRTDGAGYAGERASAIECDLFTISELEEFMGDG